jgi:translation initiation factor 2B subunit (eIF-2B alpha/beta/delta family)
MAQTDNLIEKIEEKIRTLGEQLVKANQVNASLTEEIQALKNKITDLESVVVEKKSEMVDNGGNRDQIQNIKTQLSLYIEEVDDCIDMLKQI